MQCCSWTALRRFSLLLRPRQSRGSGNGGSGECEANGVDGANASASCGFDDGADVGVEAGSPFGSETVGDLAIDRAGSQGSLRTVVCGLDVPVGHEDEQMLTEPLDDSLHRLARLGREIDAFQDSDAALRRPIAFLQADDARQGRIDLAGASFRPSRVIHGCVPFQSRVFRSRAMTRRIGRPFAPVDAEPSPR